MEQNTAAAPEPSFHRKRAPNEGMPKLGSEQAGSALKPSPPTVPVEVLDTVLEVGVGVFEFALSRSILPCSDHTHTQRERHGSCIERDCIMYYHTINCCSNPLSVAYSSIFASHSYLYLQTCSHIHTSLHTYICSI